MKDHIKWLKKATNIDATTYAINLYYNKRKLYYSDSNTTLIHSIELTFIKYLAVKNYIKKYGKYNYNVGIYYIDIDLKL